MPESPDHSNHSPRQPAEPGTFDAPWWERHHQQRAHGIGQQPSPYTTEAVAGMTPGTVLDAGCGTGADAAWLAGHGWDVTAVDISPTAIDRARANVTGDAGAQTISWVVADLMSWRPPHLHDVVLSQYVHPEGLFADFVSRLADAVAPGGTLIVVGHDHADSHSAAHAPRDAAIGTAAVTGVLDPTVWVIELAEIRARPSQHGSHGYELVDTIVRARRR